MKNTIKHYGMHFLYLAYYYPPCNSVSSYRPLSHVKSLLNAGHTVTVITRNWTGNEKGWEDYIKGDARPASKISDKNLTVHYLPFRENHEPGRFKLATKVLFFYRYVTGHFHAEIDASEVFFNKANELALKHKFDCVILSSPPLNLLKTAHRLWKLHGIKIVADFRDLWNNHLLIKNYKFSFSNRIKNRLCDFYFRKWTRGSHVMVTTVSEVLATILSKKNGKKTYVFLNGFEDELLSGIQRKVYTKFTFSSIGTMYAYYNTDNLLKGLTIFLKDKTPDQVELCFIGITAVPEVANRIATNLPAPFLRITDRLPKTEALEILKSSHVLFHTAVKEFEGAYTTKIFDYIGSGNNILISPGDDGGIIDTLVVETCTGKIARTPDEFALILQTWFEQWRKGEPIHYEGVSSKINFYSRSVQANNFTHTVLNWLS